MASLEPNAVKQALPGEEFCGQCSDKANHRQTAVELFGTLMKSPARIRCGVFHLWLTGVDVAVAFAIDRDQTSGCRKR